MRSHTSLAILTAATWANFASAQTYSTCNPLTSGSCPPDTALGKSVKIDLSSASDSFTAQGNPTYDSNGASFKVAQDGDSPQLTSKWYLMFGHVDFVVKAAAGTGIVSSAVLQSDDLDEIDWEWRGGDDQQAQSNYFGKGLTTSYNRGAFHSDPGNHDGFKTYSIDWTADQITWSINGATLRTLSSSTSSQYPYPQTPMTIKVGAWCGGCPSNPPGTIQWAGGSASLGSGNSPMQVKSITATDYSTGTQYKYTGTGGTYESITAVGGTINPKGGSGSGSAPAGPSVTASSNSAPMPFDGTHSDKASSVSQPNAGGWTPTTLQTSSTATVTTYPGLPPGWTVTSSGKVVPPSAAPVTSPPASPSSSPQGSSPDAGSEVITTYNEQGFPVVVTQAPGASQARHYDDQGFLITTSAAPDNAASSSGAAQAQADTTSSGAPVISKVSPSPTSAAGRVVVGVGLGVAGGILGVVLLL